MSSENRIVAQAFEAAATACGGKPQMLAALNISESWMYSCIKRNRVELKMALKLQVLTKLEFKWQELCPDEYKEIQSVSKFITN